MIVSIIALLEFVINEKRSLSCVLESASKSSDTESSYLTEFCVC